MAKSQSLLTLVRPSADLNMSRRSVLTVNVRLSCSSLFTRRQVFTAPSDDQKALQHPPYPATCQASIKGLQRVDFLGRPWHYRYAGDDEAPFVHLPVPELPSLQDVVLAFYLIGAKVCLGSISINEQG